MTDARYHAYASNPGRLIIDILAHTGTNSTAADIARRVFCCDATHPRWTLRYRLVYRMLRMMAADGMVRRIRRRYSCVERCG